MKKVKKTLDSWRKKLSDEQFRVCRLGETEPPFTGEFLQPYIKGVFKCVCCGNALFASEQQFDAGCGWPSYWQAINEKAVWERDDFSYGMQRIEVLCSGCDAHLGHVFPDGPQPTGLRYCINSVCLEFEPSK
ncbi:peptide-methionine (R)-S-oxide reductase MsrB [Pseudomonas sp. F1_0610]|uniref:peptide-methionine (R)-S-oxide reductase MsrB n=1 Tax=Pseudomonas sp. F1_0610 TaxID=3114284 RepID=UPI0039C2B9D2